MAGRTRESFWNAGTLRKAFRTAMEVVLLVLIAGFLFDRLTNPFLAGGVLVGTLVGVVLLVLWTATDLSAAQQTGVSPGTERP